MIRWNFVIKRLIVVVLILFLIRWGLGPLAGYLTVLGIETATGAKAEIAQTRVGLFPPRVQYADVKIADPRGDKSMKDAFRADIIDMVIDGDALLHRRLVASEGRVTGITIGADREVSGHYDRQPDPQPSGPSWLDGLLNGVTDRVEDGAESFAKDLESVRRGKAIRKRWEQDYQSLYARAHTLEKDIREIRDQARKLIEGDQFYNVLREPDQLPKLLRKANEIREELASVRQQMESMPSRVQNDLVAMQQAKQIDLQKIDQYVPGNLSDSKNFGVDLITKSVREHLRTVRGYLEGGRSVADYTVVAPENERVRGVNFDLRGDRHPPGLLVRRCEISGLMRADGDSYRMTGVIENVTPEPERLAEPTAARLTLEGPQLVDIEIIRDRRDRRTVDLLTVHFPKMQVKPVRLGDADDVQLTVDEGDHELWVKLRTEGDQVEGRLVSKQVGVRLGLNVDAAAADSAVVRSLQQSLAGVDRVEVDSQFSGTWDDLRFDVQSNLGNVLRHATRDALALQVGESRQELAARINAEHAKQTEKLNEWLASHQGQANELMRSADNSIAEITEKISEKTNRFADRVMGAIEGKLR